MRVGGEINTYIYTHLYILHDSFTERADMRIRITIRVMGLIESEHANKLIATPRSYPVELSLGRNNEVRNGSVD